MQENVYKGKRILVTGGSGFIGAHAARRLADAGAEVVIIDNLNDYYSEKLKRDRMNSLMAGRRYEFERLDIADRGAVERLFSKFKFDSVCHLAAQAGVRHSLSNPWIYEQSNVLGTINLLEQAKLGKVGKFIFASSSSVYGGNAKQPFSESDPVDQPISLYAATKRSDELIAYTYHHLYGIRIAALRFFTVYGPWGRPDMALYKFANLIMSGKPIEVYNHGNLRRDFTFIDDIVGGIIAVMQTDWEFEIFNLGNDKPEELSALISELEKGLGRESEKRMLPMQPGDVPATWADIGKARDMLGYEPKTSLENGVAKFVDWYKWYHQDKFKS